jgi:hypothetical protein
MEINLSVDENLFLSKLSRNWRRNLAAAREKHLITKLDSNPNIQEICRTTQK